MTDYDAILGRAIASLEPNTAQARTVLFDRARALLLQQFENDRERWTDAAADAELANFDATVDRIEASFVARTTSESIGRFRPADLTAAQSLDAPPAAASRPRGRIVLAGVAGLAVVLMAAAAYLLQARGPAINARPPAKTTETKGVETKALESKRAASIDGDGDLAPGTDGGSTEAGLPYYLRRQAVYYRSVYSVGMVVVDRSQRFLYLVQPQSRALRYGIGVGGECDVGAGLYRIRSMVQWPEWSPSPELRKRRSYPARLAGGPGNPLGAAALYFESKAPGIHGTNAPRSIGQAPEIGCIRLVNDDVVDLEKRIAIGTGVVVLN